MAKVYFRHAKTGKRFEVVRFDNKTNVMTLRGEHAEFDGGGWKAVSPQAALLTFDDSGRGLPEEFYASGISHFQRFDNSRSRESGGSGLGMSILAAIVRKHGGEVHLSKSDLGGLRTEIRLPLAN